MAFVAPISQSLGMADSSSPYLADFAPCPWDKLPITTVCFGFMVVTLGLSSSEAHMHVEQHLTPTFPLDGGIESVNSSLLQGSASGGCFGSAGLLPATGPL